MIRPPSGIIVVALRTPTRNACAATIRSAAPAKVVDAAQSTEVEQWDTAMNSQAKAFLVGVRKATTMMPDGGRIIAITYAPGGKYGSWQSWVGMGAAKSALEVLARYFAVALAPRGITVNTISPGWIEDSVLNTLAEALYRASVQTKSPRGVNLSGPQNNAGSDLLSHTVSHTVPSAVSGLTSVFGMGTGGTLIL